MAELTAAQGPQRSPSSSPSPLGERAGMRVGMRLPVDPVMPAEVEGELLVSQEPLSFWGGYDALTGEIIDRRHPLNGQCAMGKVLALPFTRGSSTTTAVLLEAVRRGTAPAALLSTGTDTFFALASLAAEELYGKPIPVFSLTAQDFAWLESGLRVRIHADGVLEFL